MKNLWNKEIKTKDIETPQKMINDQIEFLSTMTDGMVYGELEDVRVGNKSNTFVFNFNLKALKLKNYKYRILSLEHDIAIYPSTILLDEQLLLEIEDSLTLHDIKIAIKPISFIQIKDKTEFEIVLEAILSSDRIKNIVVNMKSMVKEIEDEFDMPF